MYRTEGTWVVALAANLAESDDFDLDVLVDFG